MLAAEHSFHAGDVRKAIDLLEQAADSATPGPLRAEVLSRLADVSAVTEGCGPAEALYTRALAEPDLDARQRVEILGELAFHTAARGDTRSGFRYAEEGLALAEQLGDPVVLSHSRIAVAIATFFRTACIRRDLLEPAIDLAVEPVTSRRPVTARATCSRFSSVEPIAATRHVRCGEH